MYAGPVLSTGIFGGTLIITSFRETIKEKLVSFLYLHIMQLTVKIKNLRYVSCCSDVRLRYLEKISLDFCDNCALPLVWAAAEVPADATGRPIVAPKMQVQNQN